MTQEEWDEGERGPFYAFSDAPEPHTMLWFPKHWIGTILPAEWKHPTFNPGTDQTYHFVVEYLDTETHRVVGADSAPMNYGSGLVIPTRYWPHYEEYPDDEYGNISIHRYFYQDHECACHRKSIVESNRPDLYGDLDDECEGERFKIRAIYAPEHLPGIILFSEVLSEEECYDLSIWGSWPV